VDVVGEIVPDDFWAQVDARSPLFDQIFNVQEAMVARRLEVFDELGSS